MHENVRATSNGLLNLRPSSATDECILHHGWSEDQEHFIVPQRRGSSDPRKIRARGRLRRKRIGCCCAWLLTRPTMRKAPRIVSCRSDALLSVQCGRAMDGCVVARASSLRATRFSSLCSARMGPARTATASRTSWALPARRLQAVSTPFDRVQDVRLARPPHDGV
jgi:hypothetical protein